MFHVRLTTKAKIRWDVKPFFAAFSRNCKRKWQKFTRVAQFLVVHPRSPPPRPQVSCLGTRFSLDGGHLRELRGHGLLVAVASDVLTPVVGDGGPLGVS